MISDACGLSVRSSYLSGRLNLFVWLIVEFISESNFILGLIKESNSYDMKTKTTAA